MGRIYRRGQTYHAYWTAPDGTAHRRSLRTGDPVIARTRLRQLELASTDPAAHSGHTLGEALDAMFAAMKPGPTYDSYQQKARHLNRLLDREAPLSSLRLDHVNVYIATRLREGAHPHTLHKEMVVLRKAIKHAIARQVWSGDVSKIVPTTDPKYQPRDRWLTREQADAVASFLGTHRRLWFWIGCFAGLRDSEIENLCWCHVDLDNLMLQAPGTKTKSAWRKIPIDVELAAMLEDAASDAERRGHGPGDRVVRSWASVRRDLSIAMTATIEGGKRKRRPKGSPPWPKITPLTPNDLRRTFASWLVQAGVPLLVVARLLGHNSTRMVERVYGIVSDAAYRDAIAKLPRSRPAACAAGVQHAVLQDGADGAPGTTTTASGSAGSSLNLLTIQQESPLQSVPNPGIEPGTRGFSGPSSLGRSNVIPLRKVK